MEYAYAVLLLEESGVEINEDNLAAVLSSADVEVDWSTVKATVAALEDVHIQDVIANQDAPTAEGVPESVSGEAPTVASGTDGRSNGDQPADVDPSTGGPGSVGVTETEDQSADIDGTEGS